jgi:membrane protein required for colicin V production
MSKNSVLRRLKPSISLLFCITSPRNQEGHFLKVSVRMIFDLVVIAALLISSLIAFLRGFIREVLTVLGVIGGTFAAVALGPKLAPTVESWLNGGHPAEHAAKTGEAVAKAEETGRLFGILPYNMAADLIAYGGVFIVVVIILSIISHMTSGFARKLGLGMVDRTLGIFFGIARALVLLALPYYVVSVTTGKEFLDKQLEDSHTRVYIEGTADWIGQFVPVNFADDLGQKTDKASASMADATREKLRELNVLGGDVKDEAKDAAGDLKGKGKDAGEALRESGEALKDKMQDAGQAIRDKIDQKTQPGYEDQQRGQMDGLIQQENDATMPPQPSSPAYSSSTGHAP